MSVYRVPYPFVRCRVSIHDGEGGNTEIDSWKPGITYLAVDHYGEEVDEIAHGMGVMILTEVSRHKPGKYPERVFYTRSWETPEGVAFGKLGLRMTTARAFANRCKGFAHPFRVFDTGEAA